MVAQVRSQLVEVEGVIAHIRFKSEENGYVVLSFNPTGSFDEFVAVGTMPDAVKGMPVTIQGGWVNHPRFGKQFKFDRYAIPQPTDKEGTIAYLSTLKCIKESIAARIYETFGEDVYRILDEESDRLIEVRGIGKKTLPKIVESYQKTKGMRKLIAFLHELGVSASYAARIYREYGEESIATIKGNPYILADAVRGFGFKKADEVARGLGIEPDSAIRVEAAILHTLKQASNQGGHCYLPKPELCSQVCELLLLPGFTPTSLTAKRSIGALARVSVRDSQRVIIETIDGEPVVYQWRSYVAECELADFIRDMAGRFENAIDVDAWLRSYEEREGIALADGQRDAVRTAALDKVMVMTGGAGVGKSATSKAIVQLWHSQGKRIIACAPTGRAAQRIREATGIQASTIHRLLGWSGTGFERNRDNPIAGDAFLIDESSMMDVRLAHSLFQAIPRHASVVLVGDVNQLPSVGAGNVLRDIINSDTIPVARLTQVFRQGATSRIISCSHQVNAGQFPDFELFGTATDKPITDALWVKCQSDKIKQAIEWLTTNKLIELGWQPDDIQVLSPMNKGIVGNIALNEMMQQLWNPPSKLKAEARGFREGDRVIQTRNNYDKGIFNGDIGKIERIDKEDKEVSIRFPDLDNPMGKVVTIDESELEDVMLANAISIHRSQGSEFPVVIVPVSPSQAIMLVRNLLYTGITRAKKLLVLVGEERAIAQAVKTQRISQRNTALDRRLGGSL